MLLMPIMTHGELWGGLGIESKTDRIWGKRAIDVFKTMADLIGAAITRERSLRESEERLQTVFNFVSDGIFVVEPGSGKFIDANPAAAKMFGYRSDEIIGKNIMELSSGVHAYTKETAGEIIGKALRGQPQTFEWQFRAKDGRLFWGELSIKGAAFGQREVLLTTVRDITKRKAAQEQVVHLAYHDVLTGLANRRVFVKTLRKAIARARRNNLPFAVLYLDLDHFKDINETLGHPIGDLLLQSVSQRLRASARESDTVARFGGDEFAVLTTAIHQREDAAVLAQRLLVELCAPFKIRGRKIRTGASIGIAVYGADAPDAEGLLSHSDLALYRAKAEGRGAYRFFTSEMDEDVRRRVKLSGELRKAIDSGQLFLAY
jgi:diguanylate cyclase (GGDEF)-like protein/PAS domain S-box-containing protein